MRKPRKQIDTQKVLMVMTIISGLFALGISATILVDIYFGGWRLLVIRLTLHWPAWLRAILWGWW